MRKTLLKGLLKAPLTEPMPEEAEFAAALGDLARQAWPQPGDSPNRRWLVQRVRA